MLSWHLHLYLDTYLWWRKQYPLSVIIGVSTTRAHHQKLCSVFTPFCVSVDGWAPVIFTLLQVYACQANLYSQAHCSRKRCWQVLKHVTIIVRWCALEIRKTLYLLLEILTLFHEMLIWYFYFFYLDTYLWWRKQYPLSVIIGVSTTRAHPQKLCSVFTPFCVSVDGWAPVIFTLLQVYACQANLYSQAHCSRKRCRQILKHVTIIVRWYALEIRYTLYLFLEILTLFHEMLMWYFYQIKLSKYIKYIRSKLSNTWLITGAGKWDLLCCCVALQFTWNRPVIDSPDLHSACSMVHVLCHSISNV